MVSQLIATAHSISQFLQYQSDYIYMFYGLAFALLAAIYYLMRRDQTLPVSWKWFGLFSLTHCIGIWLDMFAASLGDTVAFSYTRLCIHMLSYIFLLVFGREGSKKLKGKEPGASIYIFLSLFALMGIFAGTAGFEASIRYTFLFVGGLWSAMTLYRASKADTNTDSRALKLAAVMFAAYSVISAVVVPDSAYPPITMINLSSFMLITGIPVHLVEGILVLFIAVALWIYRKRAVNLVSSGEEQKKSSHNEVFMIFTMLIILTAGWIATEMIGRNADSGQRKYLLDQTNIAIVAIDPANVAQLTGNASDIKLPAYKLLEKQLSDIHNADIKIHRLCLMIKQEERILLTVVSDPEEYSLFETGKYFYAQPPVELLDVFKTGRSTVAGPYTGEWGAFLSGFAAVRDPSNQQVIGVFSMDITVSGLKKAVAEARLAPVCITLLVFLLVFGFFMSRKLLVETTRLISASERNLKETQKASRIASWSYDAGTKEYSCTKEMIHILGYECEDLELAINMFRKRIYPINRTRFDTFVQKVIKEKKECESQILIDCPGGTMLHRYIYLKAQVKSGINGDITHIMVTAQDVTERRRNEELVQESRDNLKQVLEIAAFPIFILTKGDLAIRYSNHAAMDYYELIPEQQKIFDSSFICTDTENMKKIADEINKKGFVDDYEVKVKTATGKIKWVVMSNHPIIYNRQDCILSTHFDITELKEIEEKLKAARDDAERANAAKSEFLANMSHEIRTPLNAIIGFSELLYNLIIDTKHRSYIESINTAGKSLLTLINDILDLSKIEAGMMEIQLVPINPRSIFDEIAQIFKQKIQNKNLQYITEIDEELPKALLLDETRLRQVLLNLMGNAVKFTEKGYIKLTAHKVLSDVIYNSKINLIITIEDTGVGISKDSHETIFESFKQQSGQSTRKYGGTGLGLSISKKLVRMMNGGITLKSEIGQGSSFIVSLFDVDIASADTLHIDEQEFSYHNITFETAKVLVVDDIESNRRLIVEMLGKVGLDVLTAENGLEALSVAEEMKPDVILMDIKMPVMDGNEATRRLKEDPVTNAIPVIALTASVANIDNSSSHGSLFEVCLAKPVTFNKLITELAKHLRYRSIDAFVDKSSPGPVPEDSTLIESELQPGFEVIIREQIIPLVKKLDVALKITDASKLAKLVADTGKQYGNNAFQYHGDELAQAVKCFDINTIRKKLADISALLINISIPEG